MIYCAEILHGDARERLREIPAESVQCVVTSPPYWGLRDYGVVGQLGLERTPEEYVANMVAVFREVRRVLRDDGTLWLNLGDSYTSAGGGGEARMVELGRPSEGTFRAGTIEQGRSGKRPYAAAGFKPKDLIGIPWRVAFALQADGWWLRSDIVWSKPNPMPESVSDRPTKAHEYLFLLSKSASYYYDADAIAEPAINEGRIVKYDGTQKNCEAAAQPIMRTRIASTVQVGATRNRRTVWTIATQRFPGAHFAVMPEALVEPCILAGSRHGDLIVDPFAGAGTVGVVALKHGRAFVGVELNPKYAAIAETRIVGDAPLLNQIKQLPLRGTDEEGAA